ncbi:MAG: hypothetical protein ACYDGO_05635 [Smithellaceae bacterium]
MKHKAIILLLGLLILFVASPACADVVWPALYLISRMVTWWSIAVGLVVEYLFVRQLTQFDIKKSIIVDLSMNVASCLVGIILIPLLGVGWEVFPGIVLYKMFGIGTFNPGTWTATFLIAVFVNAFLENFVINKGFKKTLGWRGFWWLSIANGVSVGIALVSIWLVPVKG